MVSITPRSFSGGDYFRRFRQSLFRIVTPDRIHLFGSRKEAFRGDAVLQENVILRARRILPSKNSSVGISQSLGLTDLPSAASRTVPLRSVIDLNSPVVALNLPTSPVDDEVVDLLRGWRNSLESWRLQVSTGPVVAFRAEESLRSEADQATVPLLWLNNITPLSVKWPLENGKPQYISSSPRKLLVPNDRNYVLLRRFTAKEERRRLLAAPLYSAQLPGDLLGLENHLNYVSRPLDGLTEDEVAGLAALFNSALLDRYIRISNGNTQVNASELRALPLPDPEQISSIGRVVRANEISFESVDSLIAEQLDLPPELSRSLKP